MDTIEAIIAALDAVAADPAWQWPWRYRWRTAERAGGLWKGDVVAGYFDADWKPIGATPRWVGTGATEVEALARAAGYAIDYWARVT